MISCSAVAASASAASGRVRRKLLMRPSSASMRARHDRISSTGESARLAISRAASAMVGSSVSAIAELVGRLEAMRRLAGRREARLDALGHLAHQRAGCRDLLEKRIDFLRRELEPGAPGK